MSQDKSKTLWVCHLFRVTWGDTDRNDIKPGLAGPRQKSVADF